MYKLHQCPWGIFLIIPIFSPISCIKSTSESCLPLEGTLSCPDWSNYQVNSRWYQSNTTTTTNTITKSVKEFDQHIYKLLDPNNLPPSSNLIDDPTCSTIRTAVSQLSQPLLCATSVTDPINAACPNYPKPICHNSCTRQVDKIMAIVDKNPTCFKPSNQANFYDARSSLIATCSKSNLQGDKGTCLTLDAKVDGTSNDSYLLDSKVVIGVGVGGGLMVLFLILTVTVVAFRRRHRQIKIKTEMKSNPSNDRHPQEHCRTLITDFPFFARREDEVQLGTNDEVCVYHEFDDGWAYGKNFRTGHTGKFPLICLNSDLKPNNNKVLTLPRTSGMMSVSKGEPKQRIIPMRTSSSSINITNSGRIQLATTEPRKLNSNSNSNSNLKFDNTTSFDSHLGFIHSSTPRDSLPMGLALTPTSSYRRDLEFTTSDLSHLPDIAMTHSYKPNRNHLPLPPPTLTTTSSPDTAPASSLLDSLTAYSEDPRSTSRLLLSPIDHLPFPPPHPITPHSTNSSTTSPFDLSSELPLPHPTYATTITTDSHHSSNFSYPMTPPPPARSPPPPPPPSHSTTTGTTQLPPSSSFL